MSGRKKPAPSAHCRVTPLHWSRYLEGELSTAECRRCETHLQDCDVCREQLRGMRQAVRACRAAGVTAVPTAVKAAARRRTRALLSRPPH